ncbi:class I SAM-dependent methyltransferase [Subsaximicrobium wynnwilliamsii]|uniref:Class I SAM-dependent methyltransferase n=1 Tax=Subsaximicrobium wynnwilliamsii TaxID=291179 RepID=A0A5C6ZIX3_9FLAO|nr:class I SAM-dependent methyltransferase [Subsaximicrobium wynnwilliamsii]TXD82886.1 class I SAM-dependent methyltransferase [Subsaximicrobium wynnwilliamsii]TXD88608.1 class I SAM-dependent methyltransferase [Subsaximicrobium wynnwilliamsii]TXE02700.1 class I SAM-dependent methyltransferase [Subsaximicrobium wynnwilliamsii]
MKSKQKDYFAEKAEGYDGDKSRTQNVDNIAETILKELSFSKEMHIMDFGSGTGLLLSQIAPYVGEITAVDISASMIGVLQSKMDTIDCKLQIVQMDLTKETLDKKFDAIMSSMTIHHIAHVQALFNTFHALLNDDGTIAIADLDTEDGSFHSEDTGVFHNGFDRNEFLSIAKHAGFRDLKIQTASVMKKETGHFPVFLLTGKK